MPVVYIDVVWLVNLVMDAALLWTTCWILKRPVRPARIAAGAVMGSLYALLVFVPSVALLTTWPGKAVVSLIMVAVAIPWRNLWDLARIAAIYYLAACVFAGAALALHFAVPGVSLARGLVTARGALVFWSSVGTLALLVTVPIAAALLRAGIGQVRRQRLRYAATVAVRARVGDQEVAFVGLVDTGNQLRDPVSRRPVCLVDSELLATLFPPSARPLLLKADWEQAAAVVEGDIARRLSFVPFCGAGGGLQFTLAIRPDVLEVQQSGRWVAAPLCLLALHPGRLAHDAAFQAILHTEVLTGVDGDDREHRAEKASVMAAAPETVVDADSHPFGGRS
jgi:stage II sporulation protein GA (sporulation sigma-E factor processing peptidase)